MRIADFDFKLPDKLIALRPAEPRTSAKLLQVGDQVSDHHVADLPRLLRSGDILVFNNTKVVPAALSGTRIGRTGASAKIEVLLHQRLAADNWLAFARPAKKLTVGDTVHFGELKARVEAKGEAGEIMLAFDVKGEAFELALERVGRMPLPPYIESRRSHDAQDRMDYQTIFAKRPGAVAAPTATLHFTHDLLKTLQDNGITSEFVTLHVGAGTFLPVKVDDTKDHKMHFEWGEVSAASALRLQQARRDGRRVIAVGTTTLRILETARSEAFSGNTNIFIEPGYRVMTVDGLITNFHLPRSTLFMLVSALCGVERMKAAYAHAIEQNYRFYSYGDASLLWPAV